MSAAAGFKLDALSMLPEALSRKKPYTNEVGAAETAAWRVLDASTSVSVAAHA